jgi:hypothetical protein
MSMVADFVCTRLQAVSVQTRARRDKERGDNASRHCSPEARRNEQLSVTTTIGRT